MTDRPLRPLFPEGWACETQVIALVSRRPGERPRCPGGHGRLLRSEHLQHPLPHPHRGRARGCRRRGPISSTRPTELETSRLDLVVAGSEEAIVMVEAGANEISEEEMLKALWRGHDAIKIAVEHEMVAELGSPAVPSPLRGARRVRERLEQDWRSVWPPPCGLRQAEELCGRGRPQGRDAGQLRRR